MRTLVNGRPPNWPLHTKMLRYVMTVAKKKVCLYSEKKSRKAGEVIKKTNSAPLSSGKKKKVQAT